MENWSVKKQLCLIFGGGAVLLIFIFLVAIFYDGNGNKNDLTEPKENLDGLQGNWAKVDNTTRKVDKSEYLSFDGKGNVTYYISGYSLNYNYTFDDKVSFENWSCSLKSTPYSDGSKQYRLECWSDTTMRVFIRQ